MTSQDLIKMTPRGVFLSIFPRGVILKPEGLKDLMRSFVASLLRMRGQKHENPPDPSIKITAPLGQKQIVKLKSGDKVLISGVIYSFRDAAHKRLIDLITKGKPLPFNFSGQIIYYMGPSPAKPKAVIGACGPTTSGRMDIYTPKLLEKGLKGMIGKGGRSKEVKEAIKKHKAVYFGAVGGAGALISRKIKKVEVIAFSELGPEAIRKLEVKDFPAIVINDSRGGDLYQQGRAKYKI